MKCPRCDGTGELAVGGILFGDLVCAARKAKGMTQKQLAEAVGLSRVQVTNIECNRTDTTLKRLAQFAEVLGCEVKELIP